MPDVTFGVKVTEEMKNELSQMMKNTDLTGKEFMSLLIETYKLEDSKKEKDFMGQDIGELQRLLGRIQTLYLHIGERATLLMQETEREKQESVQKEMELSNERTLTLKKEMEEKENLLKEIETLKKQELLWKEENEKVLQRVEIQLQKEKDKERQIEEMRLLLDKYAQEVGEYQARIEEMNAFKAENVKLKEEKEVLREKSDTIASDLWFAQRELEKVKEEEKVAIKQWQKEKENLEKSYQLMLENQLLQQKIIYKDEIDALKKEKDEIQKTYMEKINTYLSTKKQEEKE